MQVQTRAHPADPHTVQYSALYRGTVYVRGPTPVLRYALGLWQSGSHVVVATTRIQIDRQNGINSPDWESAPPRPRGIVRRCDVLKARRLSGCDQLVTWLVTWLICYADRRPHIAGSCHGGSYRQILYYDVVDLSPPVSRIILS